MELCLVRVSFLFHERKAMLIVDALGTLFEFLRSIILAGQVPQDNNEGDVYNFFTILINILGFLGISI